MTGWTTRYAGLALFALTLAATRAVASDVTIDACLKTNTYVDSNKAYDLCQTALAAPDVDGKARANLLFRAGEALYWSKKPGDAIELLDEALKLDREFTEARLLRGWAYMRLQEIERAARDFTDVLSAEPDSAEGHYAIGNAMLHVSTERGLQLIRRAVELDPHYYQARHSLSVAYRNCNCDASESEVQFRYLLAEGREKLSGVKFYSHGDAGDYDFYAVIRDDYAMFLRQFYRFDEALSQVQWLVDNYPKLARPYDTRAAIFEAAHDNERGLADAEKALAIDFRSTNAARVKMRALWGQNRFEELKQFATLFVSKGPEGETRGQAFYWLSEMHERAGETDLALRDLRLAIGRNYWLAQVVTSQMRKRGYLPGPQADAGNTVVPDMTSAAFNAGLQACVYDKDC